MAWKAIGTGLLGLAVFLGGCVEVLSIPSISLSGDGDQIAFLIQTDAGQSMALQTLNLDGGDVQRIGVSENMQGAFDWDPSQTSIAFVEIAPDQSSSIQVAQLPGGRIATLTSLPHNVWVNQLAYSPDGSQMALSVSALPPGTQPRDVLDSSTNLNGSEARIYLVDTPTGELHDIARDDVTDTPSLDWNPTGTHLAYAYEGNLFVYDVAEAEAEMVNWAENLSLRSPSWLNETTLIMISAPQEEGPSQTEIVSYEVTSGRTRAWPVGPGVAAVSASPDGNFIAYIEGQPSADSSGGYATTTTTVVLLPIEEARGQAIYVGLSLDRPVWSPDSQTLFVSNGNAFSMFAGNRRQIFAVDIASGAATPLFEGPLATSSLLGWFPPQEGTPTP